MNFYPLTICVFVTLLSFSACNIFDDGDNGKKDTPTDGLSSSAISSPGGSIPIISSNAEVSSNTSISQLSSSSSEVGTSSLTFSSSIALPITQTAVYITAHEDDWQIFMGDHAYDDLMTADEVVFIYLTAGEAGKEKVFWNAREQGALNSIAWSLNEDNTGSSSLIDIDGKEVMQTILAHTTSYFLRLPDGNGNGNGFPAYGNQSIARVYDGSQFSIDNVTQTSSYNRFEIISTVRSLIQRHTPPGSQLSFHLQDHDKNINPGNHPDHITASLIGQEALSSLGYRDITLFLDYASSSQPENLDQATYEIKQGLFDAYDYKMQELAGYHTINQEGPIYYTWLKRTYFRELFQ